MTQIKFDRNPDAHPSHKSYVASDESGTIGLVWKGCGGWAGSRYANGIEATSPSRIGVIRSLLSKPRIYDRNILEPA